MLGGFLYLMISLVFMKLKFYFGIFGLVFFFIYLALNLKTLKNVIFWGFFIYLDVLSYFLVFLTLLVILYLVYSGKKSYMYMLLSMFSMLSFSVSSILQFYVFFELSILPMLYLMLSNGAQPERLQAGTYMVLYTLVGSLPLLLTMLQLMKSWDSSWEMLSQNKLDMIFEYSWTFFFNWWCFFLMLGFLMKLPMYGFHLWLPKAHVEAPTGGSVILAGVLLKLGSYGLLRMQSFVAYYYIWWWEIFVGFLLMSIVYVSLMCYRMYDFKMLIAYSSVVHMTLLASGVSQNLSISFFGGIMLSVTHGLCSSGLFGGFGQMYEVLGSRQMLTKGGFLFLGGVFNLLWFFYCFMNCSLPPSVNLIGEMLLFWSSFLFSGNLVVWICVLSVFLSGLFCFFLFLYMSWGKSSKFSSYRLLSVSFTNSFYLVIFSFFLIFFIIM